MGFKIDLPIKRKLKVVFFCSVLKMLRSSKLEKRLVYHDQITTSFFKIQQAACYFITLIMMSCSLLHVFYQITILIGYIFHFDTRRRPAGEAACQVNM